MSDLDIERRERQQAREAALGDRGFTFGGEKFMHVRDCPFDVIERASLLENPAPGTNVLREMRALVTELIEPGEENLFEHPIDLKDPEKGMEFVAYDPPRYEYHERFSALLRRKEDPITADDIGALLRWLMGAATGRPTLQSPPSEDTPSSSGTGSTARSSEQQVAASTS